MDRASQVYSTCQQDLEERAHVGAEDIIHKTFGLSHKKRCSRMYVALAKGSGRAGRTLICIILDIFKREMDYPAESDS